MPEETTESVSTTKTSDGTVKISVEKYEELTALANRPQTVVYNRVEKTPEMAANDQLVMGNVFLIAGVAQVLLGGYLRFKGLSTLKSLKA
jgi:hypothetical protein